MTQLIETALATALLLIGGESASGYTSRYDPGLMAATAAYHGISIERYDGAIAVADCSQIGAVWLLRPAGGDWLRVVVVDCAGNDGTPQWMAENNILVELSYPLAERFGAIDGGVRVEVVRP